MILWYDEIESLWNCKLMKWQIDEKKIDEKEIDEKKIDEKKIDEIASWWTGKLIKSTLMKLQVDELAGC